ncbi:sensor histidine kinase [Thalassospira sp. HJ]|uniref:sensor histidine kinase n=1 Tax=Thalassospira sp. HJ TaxID=1616823 RepID=UPI00137921F2|nr:HAMP domain-containing sensor histidine kinase [Thalassospira sp. HJ]
MALIGMLLFSGLMVFWPTVEGSREDEQTVRRLVVDVTHRSADIQQWYETAIQTVTMSILHPAVQNFRSRPDEAVAYFQTLAAEVPRFSQLRIVSPSGIEALRVDARGDDIIIIPDDGLQDKSGRYYVEAAKSLRPGQIYVSKLDLNVENGEIEVPHRPTTRIVAPIIANNQEVSGYLIVNLDMATPLTAYGVAPDGVMRTELINHEGYWLAGAEDDRNWGFMLEHNASVKQSDPELWQRIAAVDHQGGFELDGKIYEVETISVSPMLNAISSDDVHAASTRFHLVGSALSYQPWAGNIAIKTVFVAFMVMLICGLSGGVGYLMLRRRQAAQLQVLLTKDLLLKGRMASLGRIVAGVSHEMRSPLGNALTISTTMSEDLQELQQHLAKIDEGDEERVEIIAALLEGNRILQKNIQRTRELLKHFNQTATDQSVHTQRVFDLVKVVTDLAETLRNQLAKTGVELSTALPAEARMNSFSDAVDQVILSLIMNAHQHAFVGREKGAISIRVSERDADEYQIEIADDGVGISPKNQERIFEPFWSLDATTGGSGLGLAITMNVVQNTLGGQIKVSSIPGSGTVFRMFLPKVAPTRMGKHESPFAVESQTALMSANTSEST